MELDSSCRLMYWLNRLPRVRERGEMTPGGEGWTQKQPCCTVTSYALNCLSAICYYFPPNPLFPKLLEIKSIFFNFILFFPGMITTLHLENHWHDSLEAAWETNSCMLLSAEWLTPSCFFFFLFSSQCEPNTLCWHIFLPVALYYTNMG